MDNKTIDETQIKEAVEKVSGRTNVALDSQILTAVMQCGRYTDLKFNHNLYSVKGKGNSLECGSIVHKFLEVYNIALIRGIKRSDAIGFGLAAAELYIHGCRHCTGFLPSHFIDGEHTTTIREGHICVQDCILKPKCGHSVDEYEGVKNTPPESEGYVIGWKWVLETIDQYNQFYSNDSWVPLEVECVKSKILYEDSEIRVLYKVKYDLISDTNNGVYPIDHKTLKQNRPTLSLNNQFLGQCVVLGTRGMIKNNIGFQKTLPPKEKFTRSLISYSSERRMEWQSEILPYYAKLLAAYAESGVWPPNFTSCDGKYGPCMFKGVCESDPGMREEEIRNNFSVGEAWNPSSAMEGNDE